jgi:SAM-dependent methyltransferase
VKISSETVRADFNDPVAVVHYTRAAHFLGLWKSERLLIEQFFTDKKARLLEAGCGAGRVTLGLWDLGYHHLTAFDFAEELVGQALNLAGERSAGSITFLHADATRLDDCPALRGAVAPGKNFDGALFMFNGLMQIPVRERRREALRQINRLCAPDAPLLFTTHDRNSTATEQILWRLESARWAEGKQDPRLVDFGDRYFEDGAGRTFMHLPDRDEIIDDLTTTGWLPVFDAMRSKIARESRAVVDFSDECRFWVARKVVVPKTS